jgi:PAS domain S-box-containing protein
MSEHQKPERKRRSKPQSTRPTIGLLTPNVYRANEELWWQSVVDAARENGANLISFSGGYLDIPDGFEAQANILYKLISQEEIDGLVVFSSTVGWFIGKEELAEFCKGYEPLPVVSVDTSLAGIPSVVKSNYQGMREAMIHLIEAHGYRRIAFLCGPENADWAQERLRAYTETLTDYGLDVDERLIAPTPVTWEFAGPEIGPATQQINVLLNERNLKPGTGFEALVGATDSLIQEAVRTLHERGVQIPEQVAVTGFDDEPTSGVITPPLTTVRPPFYEMGYKAVEMVLALLAGDRVPEQVPLPCQLVIRQSCGCMAAEMSQSAQPTEVAEANGETLGAILGAQRAEIVADIAQAAGANSDQVESLLDAFVAEVKGQSPGLFLRELNDTLRQVGTTGGEIRLWQQGLSALRRRLRPGLDAATLALADDLWHQARMIIGEVAERAQAYQALQAEKQAQVLREVNQELITTFEIARLMDILAESLPRLSFPAGYLALYETPQPYQYPQPDLGWSRLMLAYDERGRGELAPGGQRFPSGQLLPEEMWPDRQFSFVVEPLYFQDDQIGFALFDMGRREGAPYEALRAQISSALQGALLVQRVRERSAELARQQYILDTFMENVPDSIYFKDLESRFTRMNKALARRIEVDDPAEAVGKSDYDFFPEEQARPKYEQEQEVIRTGQPILNLEEPDGVGHWALTTKMPLRDENGEIIGTFGISRDITALKEAQAALEKAYAEVEQQVAERTEELKREQEESARLQQEVIEAQQRAIQELSTPIIPVMEHVIVMPLIGSIDTMRARDVTRKLLAGIREHRARVVILDITGVPIVDSGVAVYLNRTIQAARLKGARTIVTGISEAVAETIVDLGIDWSGIETLRDLRVGLQAVMAGSRRHR